MELFITVKNPALCQYGDCSSEKQRRFGKYCSCHHEDAARSLRLGRNCTQCGKESIHSTNLCLSCYTYQFKKPYAELAAWAKTVSCSISDCTRKVMPTSSKSNPLCQHHYNLKKYAAIFGVNNP